MNLIIKIQILPPLIIRLTFNLSLIDISSNSTYVPYALKHIYAPSY